MAMGQTETKELNILSTIATNKVILLIGSDELRDSLVKDFDLYHHYGINPEEQFSHEIVLSRLADHIHLIRDAKDVGVLCLSVVDGDRFLAAKIANRVVDRINEMNQQILMKDLKQKADQYEKILPKVKEIADSSRQNFLTFVGSEQPMAMNGGDGSTRDKVRLIGNDLEGKMNRSTWQYEDVAGQYYSLISKIKTVGDDRWQGITVIQKALPDINSNGPRLITYAVFAGLGAMLFYVFIALSYYQNEGQSKQIIMALRGKKVPEDLSSHSAETPPPAQ